MLGLRRCTGFSLAVVNRGYFLVVVCRLLIVMRSSSWLLLLQSTGSRAQ